MKFKLVKSDIECSTDVVGINDCGDDTTIVEVSAHMYGEAPITIDEYKYRLKTSPKDPGARWINRTRAVDYVGEKGINAGERNVRFQVKLKNSYIDDAKNSPLYEKMKALVDRDVEHFESDFTVRDCEALGRGVDHFIWITHPNGTWMLTCQWYGFENLIDDTCKEADHHVFLAKNGNLTPVDKAAIRDHYQTFPVFEKGKVGVLA